MPDLICPNCGGSAALPLRMTCTNHRPAHVEPFTRDDVKQAITRMRSMADEVFPKQTGLPIPYGTGALEPPDDLDDDADYMADMAADAKAMRNEGN